MKRLALAFLARSPRAPVLLPAIVSAILLGLLLGFPPAPTLGALPGGNGLIAWQNNNDLFFANSQIWVMNPDGTDMVQLTTTGRNGHPSWSPNGSQIAFASNRDGNDEIYVMNADGSGQTRLTNSGSTDTSPSWSPDGSQIAFASFGASYDILVMNVDGSSQTNITNHPAEDLYPSWSPDGSKIAFQTNRDGDGEIYTVNSDGTGLANVSNSSSTHEGGPNWSPDGSTLVFESFSSGSQDIYVMNAAGGGATKLTSTGNNSMPAWSPDGSKIVFKSSRDFNDEIYAMNADGSGQTRLTNNAPPGNTLPEDWFPDWQPIVENQLPIGTHDGFEGEAGPFRCRANGWAVDPDDRYADLNIRILSDGVEVASGVANLFRQDLLDAGVSPDGISAFHINLWGLVSLNIPHLITAQAQDAQSAEWVDLNLTPRQLTCVATTSESPNPKLAFFTADCLFRGTVFVESVFFANDDPRGGSTSAFRVIGENTTFIVYTSGTDMNADDLCLFGWTGGWEPQPPWNGTFLANVFVTPKN